MERFKVRTGFSDNSNNQSIFTPDNKELHCQMLSVQKQPIKNTPGTNFDIVTEFEIPFCDNVAPDVNKGGLYLIVGGERYSVNDLEIRDGFIRVKVCAEIIP